MNNNSFACTLSSDFFKLKKLKSVWIALIVMFTLALISYAAYRIGVKIVSVSDFGGEEYAKQEALALLSEMKNTLLFGSASTLNVELFIAIIACIFIGKDFSCGSIAVLTARGEKRVDNYFSKWITLYGLYVVYTCFALLICGIFYAFDAQKGAFTSADFGMLMRNFGLQLLSGLASVSIFVMIAYLARSTGSSIAISVCAYVLLSIVISLVSTIVAMNGKENSNVWTYFMPMQQLSIASTHGKLSSTQIVAATVMPIVYAAAATLVGYFTFDARDIK